MLNDKGLGTRSSSLTRADERRLLTAARRGDAAALRRVLQLVSGPVYRFGRTFCGNVEDAEEVMQDVMTALVRSLDHFRGEASLTTWAYTVARNTCGRKRRRRSGEPQHIRSLQDEGMRDTVRTLTDRSADPPTLLERGELRDALQSAIENLPTVQREVLLLRDVEGLPAKAVAKTLKIGERAVKSRLHRARVALREVLRPIVNGGDGVAGVKRCPDIVSMLSKYMEGQLDSSVCARMEAHVRECRSCGEACDALQASLRSCRRWGNAPIPPDMRRRIRQAITRVVTEMRTPRVTS
jgi:RNA polymerase sigma-70 factor (ECF subfamily)